MLVHEPIYLRPDMQDAMRQDLDGIIELARGSRLPVGFGYLNSDGSLDPERPAELWITCRMTHVFSLAHLMGYPGAQDLANHGINALRTYFHDPLYGGWYSSIEPNPDDAGDAVPVDDSKAAYAHAFVLLAANSGVAADCDGAEELLDWALESQNERWYEEPYGRVRESWDRAFTVTEAYRGINANMHTVEAYLAVADLTDNRELLDRAVNILHFVATQSASHNWRIPEHFDEHWNILPDYNIDEPAHPFRPFGVTPGHALEWSRLMLQARGSLIAKGETPPEWMLTSARALYNQGVADGWQVDGAPGFIYTTDFGGETVVRQRMHWVLAEAIGAAVVTDKVLAEEDPESLERENLNQQIGTWWEYAQEYLIEKPGHWLHEVDGDNRFATGTWPGKPDAYHVMQMLILPRLPVSPAFAAALRAARN